MGLKPVEDVEGQSSDDSDSSSSTRSRSSTSSSGSSSDHPFPKYERRCPQAVVKDTDDGIQFFWYPDPAIKPVPFSQQWYGQPYEMDCARPEEWEHVWWSKEEFAIDERAVEQVYDYNLMKILKDRPERGLELRREARKKFARPERDATESQMERPCRVCENRLDIREDEYERVENSLICPDHSTTELIEAGVL